MAGIASGRILFKAIRTEAVIIFLCKKIEVFSAYVVRIAPAVSQGVHAGENFPA